MLTISSITVVIMVNKHSQGKCVEMINVKH